MARSVGRRKRGGVLRTAERLGMNRGLFGGSKGWLYVGTGLWTLRKVRSMASRKSEVLLSEELRPGERLIIANGRATIDSVGSQQQGLVTRGSRRQRRKRAKAG